MVLLATQYSFLCIMYQIFVLLLIICYYKHCDECSYIFTHISVSFGKISSIRSKVKQQMRLCKIILILHLSPINSFYPPGMCHLQIS